MAGVEGRVALITGAGRGIGREVAEHAGSAYNSSKHGLLGLMRSVAEMIAFLASVESSGVSGQAIKVALGGICQVCFQSRHSWRIV